MSSPLCGGDFPNHSCQKCVRCNLCWNIIFNQHLFLNARSFHHPPSKEKRVWWVWVLIFFSWLSFILYLLFPSLPPPLLPSLSFPSFFLSFPSPLPSPPFPFLLPLAFYIASFRCLRLRLFAIFIYHSLFFPFPFHSFAYFSLWSGHANGLSIPTFPYDFFSHRTVLRIARPNTQEHTRIDTSGGSCEQGRGRVFSWPISTHQNRDDAQIKFASQCP